MGKHGRARQYDYAEVKQLAASGITYAEVAARIGCSYATVRNILKSSDAPRKTQSRFPSVPLTGRPAGMPPFDHPALVSARTIYPGTVVVGRDRRALKSGHSTAKLGERILKGKWEGFPIQLASFVERLERLTEEKADLSRDIRDVYEEAKSNGFNVKALRAVIRLRSQDKVEREELAAIVDTPIERLARAGRKLGEALEAQP